MPARLEVAFLLPIQALNLFQVNSLGETIFQLGLSLRKFLIYFRGGACYSRVFALAFFVKTKTSKIGLPLRFEVFADGPRLLNLFLSVLGVYRFSQVHGITFDSQGRLLQLEFADLAARSGKGSIIAIAANESAVLLSWDSTSTAPNVGT